MSDDPEHFPRPVFSTGVIHCFVALMSYEIDMEELQNMRSIALFDHII